MPVAKMDQVHHGEVYTFLLRVVLLNEMEDFDF